MEQIYKQTAIDVINALHDKPNAWLDCAVDAIKALPPVQSDRKVGTWTTDASCPFCGFKPWYEKDIHTLSFCPNCGSDMRGQETNVDDINKFIDELEKILAHVREREVGDSVCGLCEYDGAYLGESGDWCNECPGFQKDDCFKLSDKCRQKWIEEIKALQRK